MGVISDKSTTRIVTLDNFKFENKHQTRDEAFSFLKNMIKEVPQYKQASIFDTNTGLEVLSLRIII
jgi:hypothetical protein